MIIVVVVISYVEKKKKSKRETYVERPRLLVEYSNERLNELNTETLKLGTL